MGNPNFRQIKPYGQRGGLSDVRTVRIPRHVHPSGESMKPKTKYKISLIFLIPAVLAYLASRLFPSFGEWYATHVYDKLTATIGQAWGFLPFSASEILLYLALIVILGTLIRALYQLLIPKKGSASIASWFSTLTLFVCILLFVFVFQCGINYQRTSFSKKEGIPASEYTVDSLSAVCTRLTGEVNARSAQVSRNSEGFMTLSEDSGSEAVKAMTNLAQSHSSLQGFYPRAKKLLLPHLLSTFGLSGIYSPFTIEANYNNGMTPYNIPFTACHELSHLRGFMREDEANFIAFLACTSYGNPDFQYSGYLSAWHYCMNELNRLNPASYDQIRATLNSAATSDVDANNAFWNVYDGALSKVSDKVNDTYLKANGQQEGIDSYNKMVELVVAYYS